MGVVALPSCFSRACSHVVTHSKAGGAIGLASHWEERGTCKFHFSAPSQKTTRLLQPTRNVYWLCTKEMILFEVVLFPDHSSRTTQAILHALGEPCSQTHPVWVDMFVGFLSCMPLLPSFPEYPLRPAVRVPSTPFFRVQTTLTLTSQTLLSLSLFPFHGSLCPSHPCIFSSVSIGHRTA